MAGINFITENYARGATLSLNTGSENAQFPLNNIKNDSPAVKFRSAGNTVRIQLDLLQTRPISFISVLNDVASEFGVTAVNARLSTTTDFSLATPLPLDLFSEQDMAYAFITETSVRYVELEITGTGSYAEVGTVFIGQAIEFAQLNLSIDSFNYAYRDLSRTQTNQYGQRFIDALPRVKTISGSLQFANLTEQEDLDNLVLENGSKLPIFMVVDKEGVGMNDGESKLSIYGYLQSDVTWSAQGGQHFSTNITVSQAT